MLEHRQASWMGKRPKRPRVGDLDRLLGSIDRLLGSFRRPRWSVDVVKA